MEVSLLEADGIPEGCLISVRAGSTRRQAPAEANKPCKLWFPRGFQSANPFKVDLLAPLGSSVLEVNPQKDKYPIEVKQRYGGEPMRITLRVREEANENGTASPLAFKNAPTTSAGSGGQFAGIDAALAGTGSAHESPARRHQMAIEARGYLDEHNLLQWVQGLLQELIKDRPGDPWTYIDKQTAKMKQKLGKPSEAPKEASPPPVIEIPKQAPSVEEPAKETPPKKPSSAEGKGGSMIGDLRSRARKALEGEAERQKTPLKSQASSAELFAKPEETWMQSPSVGTWCAPRLVPSAAAAAAAPSAVTETKAATQRSPTDSLRLKVCQSLAQASYDGRLEAAFQNLREESAPTARPWAPHPCMFGGPMGMAGTMHGAHLFLATSPQPQKEEAAPAPESATGTLNFATSTMTTSASITDPRVHVNTQDLTASTSDLAALDRVTPGQCLHSNAPSRALSSAPTPSAATAPTPALTVESQPAASWMPHPLLLAGGGCGVALSMGARTIPASRLMACVPSAAPATTVKAKLNVEELQQRAKNALVKGLTEGSLMTVLEESTAERRAQATRAVPVQEEESEENLRRKAQAILMDGLQSGALQSHLEEVLSPKAKGNDGSSQAVELLNTDLRKQVKSALANAASDGRLAVALRQETEEAEVGRDALCTQAREVLLDACADGRLADALQRAAGAEESTAKSFQFCHAPSVGSWLSPRSPTGPKPVPSKETRPSKAEAASADAVFDAIDVNHDNKISREEFRAANEAGLIVQASKAAVQATASSPSAAPSPQPAGPAPPAMPPPEQVLPPAPKASKSAPPPRPDLSPPSARSLSATPRPNERLTPLASKPMVGGTSALDAADAELKLRQRTDRFRLENETLRKENARLKKLREAGDAAGQLCSENDRLRAELGKLMTMNKKQHPLLNSGLGTASCPKF